MPEPGEASARRGRACRPLDAHHPGTCQGRASPKLVQITIRWFSGNMRLRRLLCGKAPPFRCRELPTNLVRAAEGIAFAAARMRRKGERWAGKAEPFRTAGGEAL